MPGHVPARRALLPTVCLGVLALAGCGASSDGGPTPSASPTASATGSASATASPSPSVTAFASTCDDALALVTVSEAAGQPIIGRTSFVVGEADPSIGRLAYLNCRYGLPDATPAATAAAGATPAAAVEIGVSLYDTAERAAARVEGTISDYRSSGSAATEVPVGAQTGTVLTRRGDPATLVVAAGARTVAVSISGRVFTGNEQIAAIAALAVEKVS